MNRRWITALTWVALAVPTAPNAVCWIVTQGSGYWLGQWITSVLLVLSPLLLGARLRPALALLFPFAVGAPFVAAYAWATGFGPSLTALQVVRESTAEEFLNYLPQFLAWATLAVLVAVLYGFLYWRTAGVRLTLVRPVRWLLVGLLLLCLGKDALKNGWSAGTVILKARLQRMYPAAPVALLWRLTTGGGVIPDRRVLLQRDIVRETPPYSGREVCVLVIGESARADAFGLYHPSLPTTPLLGKRSDLIVFRDARSCGTGTIQAVPLLLTGRFPESGQYLPFLHLDLVSAFRLAGYHTAWISTQQADGEIDSFITAFSSNAETRHFLNGRLEHTRFKDLVEDYDGVILKALERTLRPGPEKLFIVLHTEGSHSPYVLRYPPSFARWPVDPTVKRLSLPPYGPAQIEALNHAYFNSVLYTDWVLNRVIEILQKDGGLSAMIYLSDHGENPPDAPVMPAGHGVLTPAVTTIPFLIWMSPEMRRQRPALESGLRGNSTLPVSTEDLFPTVCALFHLATPEADPAKNLCSPGYRPHDRRVLLLDDTIAAAP